MPGVGMAPSSFRGRRSCHVIPCHVTARELFYLCIVHRTSLYLSFGAAAAYSIFGRAVQTFLAVLSPVDAGEAGLGTTTASKTATINHSLHSV